MEPILLSIDEVEGNTTTVVLSTQEQLREKVFCVLGTWGYCHTPIHTLAFTPRHLPAITVTLRKYDPTTGMFHPVADTNAKVGLWFKFHTEDCEDNTLQIEHVYVVYDPMRASNRFELGFRKVATSIELSHYEFFEPLVVCLKVEDC